MNLCYLVLVLTGCFLKQAIRNLPVMTLVEQIKQHAAKKSLQRTLNNQILDYKAVIDLCENEMIAIKCFRIWAKSMNDVGNLDIDK